MSATATQTPKEILEKAAQIVEQPSFFARLVKIQSEIGRIVKSGVNREQNYKFVEEGAILDAVRPLLADATIFMTSGQVPGSAKVEQIVYGKNNTPGFRADIEVVFSLIDGLSSERIEYHASAYALDSGDKALQKAYTSACKYAVLKAFMISTGVDLDKESQELADRGNGKPAVTTGNGAVPKATAKQLGFIMQLAHEYALSEADLREITARVSGRPLERLGDHTMDEAKLIIDCLKGQQYLGWLKRLQHQEAQTQAQPEQPIHDPIVTPAQCDKIETKFHQLGATDRDIEATVYEATGGEYSDFRMLPKSIAERLFRQLLTGRFITSPREVV
jgi:hypothetical protein